MYGPVLLLHKSLCLHAIAALSRIRRLMEVPLDCYTEHDAVR